MQMYNKGGELNVTSLLKENGNEIQYNTYRNIIHALGNILNTCTRQCNK